jgi:hypothetical protein
MVVPVFDLGQNASWLTGRYLPCRIGGIRVEWHQVEASIQEIGVLASAQHGLRKMPWIESG